MKALFLIFHGFEDFNGISKKIRSQIKALKECGLDVKTCYLEENNKKLRMIDDTIIADYGNGIFAKIKKRISFQSVINYVQKEKISFIYIRYDHNSNPFTIHLVKELKRLNCKIVLEIPTYPYDKEYQFLPFAYKRILWTDQLFRRKFVSYVDYIVTFSDDKEIWAIPTINISNGIDFESIKLKTKINDTNKELHLLGVATIHPWHGFDRILCGLAEYYKKNPNYKVIFHIVGFGVPEVVDYYKRLIKEGNINDYVHFYGGLFGEKLDEIFEKCDMGIGSLARHRSNIDKIKTLKNREYAARGIPFIYSETDDDFENMPYIKKEKADDSPINIDELIKFHKSVTLSPEEIRNTILNKLSWKNQMSIVIQKAMKYNLK